MAVYISADGSIGTPRRIGIRSISPQVAMIIVAVIASIGYNLFYSNPFANGEIPAAKKQPHEHWKRMMKDDTFVRTMTDNLNKTKAATKSGRAMLQSIQTDAFMDTADFGGPDGHVAESIDFGTEDFDLEGIRVTRCSTTRTAITAYFIV